MTEAWACCYYCGLALIQQLPVQHRISSSSGDYCTARRLAVSGLLYTTTRRKIDAVVGSGPEEHRVDTFKR